MVLNIVKSIFFTTLMCISGFLILSIIKNVDIDYKLMIITSVCISVITGPLMIPWFVSKEK